ncbi:MAG: hypothetical protein HY560_09035, partial [Gemmatimonadetes bacterium]|nr:hypothetical protein [Gemmatimonadota bacterium]
MTAVLMLAAGLFPACAGGSAMGRPAPYGAPRRPALRPLPVPAPTIGALAIRVAYPREDHRSGAQDTIYASARERVQSRDSVFVFGTVGRGDARLTVNGTDVPVYPTGGWIAWLPLPDDTMAQFNLVATTASDTARVAFVAYLPPRFQPPPFGIWIDTTSFAPAGARWVRPGEELRLSLRAVEGAQVRVVLPDGREIPFRGDRSPAEASRGEIAFGTTIQASQLTLDGDRYVARWSGAFGPDPGPVMAPLPLDPADSGFAIAEAIVGPDT